MHTNSHHQQQQPQQQNPNEEQEQKTSLYLIFNVKSNQKHSVSTQKQKLI